MPNDEWIYSNRKFFKREKREECFYPILQSCVMKKKGTKKEKDMEQF